MKKTAGKSLHEDFAGSTWHRLEPRRHALLEIVTEPDMSAQVPRAAAYAKKLHELVQWIGIPGRQYAGEGSFVAMPMCRCAQSGQKEFGTRREIKNLNSFRFYAAGD